MKALQGLIWEEAYHRGEVKGQWVLLKIRLKLICRFSSIYPDVLPVLTLLNQKIPIYIYSSGSVHAQKLLFAHSVEGDMTKVKMINSLRKQATFRSSKAISTRMSDWKANQSLIRRSVNKLELSQRTFCSWQTWRLKRKLLQRRDFRRSWWSVRGMQAWRMRQKKSTERFRLLMRFWINLELLFFPLKTQI